MGRVTETFGKRLRRLVYDAGFTSMLALSKRAGIPYTTILNYMSPCGDEHLAIELWNRRAEHD